MILRNRKIYESGISRLMLLQSPIYRFISSIVDLFVAVTNYRLTYDAVSSRSDSRLSFASIYIMNYIYYIL